MMRLAATMIGEGRGRTVSGDGPYKGTRAAM